MQFKSNEIEIYPNSNRTDGKNSTTISNYGKLGKLNIEQNIIKPFKNLFDNISVRLIGDLPYIERGMLVIPNSTYLIDGYNIEIKTTKSIDLSDYTPNDTTTNISYGVYLKITLEDSNIGDNLFITELVGKDINSTYSGVELIISNNIISSPEDKYLLLGVIFYRDSEWLSEIVYNDKLNSKINFNTMGIELEDTTGLINNNCYNNAQEWLENAFVLDDGDIGE